MHVRRLTALCAYLLLHLFPRLIQEVAKHHAGAFLGEEPRFCSPLAPGPAANQCDFAIKSAHVSIPPCNKLCRKIATAPDTLQAYHRCTRSQPCPPTTIDLA